MNIKPDLVYNTFQAFSDKKILWNIGTPLSGDMVAGMVTAIKVINESPSPDRRNIIDKIILTYNGGYHSNEFNVMYNGDVILGHYIIGDNIHITEVGDYYPDEDKYGWWIQNGVGRNNYTLMTFKTADFVGGFIGVCSMYSVDFRDYVFGSPFTYIYESNQIVSYDIEGFDLGSYYNVLRIPAPIGPYYVDRNEADTGAVDFE